LIQNGVEYISEIIAWTKWYYLIDWILINTKFQIDYILIKILKLY
jgi:hypothetical protein